MDYTNHPAFIAFGAKPIDKEETEVERNKEESVENEKTETEAE